MTEKERILKTRKKDFLADWLVKIIELFQPKLWRAFIGLLLIITLLPLALYHILKEIYPVLKASFYEVTNELKDIFLSILYWSDLND